MADKKIKWKYSLMGFFFLLLIFCVVLFLAPQNIVIYIGIGNPSKDIIMQVKMDNLQIFDDTLVYHPFKYVKLEKKIKRGFHFFTVNSNEMNLNKEKKIFILFKQYIVIQYFPDYIEMNEKATFSIENYFHPFYID